MVTAQQQDLAWLARSFGRTDYLPLSTTDVEALSGAGEYVTWRTGIHLFREGAPARAAFVIRSGNVELYRTRGASRRVVGHVKDGGVIGDVAMFRDDAHASSARAVGPVTALRMERSRLLPILLEHPRITMRWLVAGLAQLESTQRRVVRLMHRTVREQVAELLLEEADRFGDVHLSQSTLATLLGASRQSVNEALADLRKDGIAETGYRRVHIVDHARLCGMVGSPASVC